MIQTILLKKAQSPALGLSVVKNHLRIDESHEDEFLLELIHHAENWFEETFDTVLMEKTYEIRWRDDERFSSKSLSKPYVLPQRIPLKGCVSEVQGVFERKNDHSMNPIRQEDYSIEQSTHRSTLALKRYVFKGCMSYVSGLARGPNDIPDIIYKGAY
jgi:hypothetical protein